MDRRTVCKRLLAQLRALPAQGLELRKPHTAQGAVIILNSYQDGRPYKLQCFDPQGLGEHYVFLHFAQALRTAVKLGYTEPTQGRLQALMDSAAWRQRYRVDRVPPCFFTATLEEGKAPFQ